LILERDRIKLKGSKRKIIIPLDPKEGKPWTKSWDEDQEAWCLYQIVNEKKYYVEPKCTRRNFERISYVGQA
jgi:hypothetical protein